MTADPAAPAVLVAREGAVATVTLSQPGRRNAITLSMWDELGRVAAELAADHDLRVVVLTGAGEDFCAGADITGFDAPIHPLQRIQQVNRTVLALHRLPVPTIARVDGVAVGAGCNLAFGCDLVVATDRARFSEMFARRALSLDAGGSWLLPHLIGLHRAKELCLLAEMITAGQAQEIGLLNRVVPVELLDETVGDLASRLAAAPPIAVQQIKRQLNDACTSSFEQALEAEARAYSVNLQGADAAEAFSAFLEKREPAYTGAPFRQAR